MFKQILKDLKIRYAKMTFFAKLPNGLKILFGIGINKNDTKHLLMLVG